MVKSLSLYNYVLVVAHLSVLVDIQALFLDTLANAQAVNLLNAVEQYYTT